jgi:anti-sigma B factor antagonist
MDLALVTTDHGGIPVLAVTGEVDLATIPKFRDVLIRLASDHPGQSVVVDLDGVGVLDDTGLGVLLGGRRRLAAQGGQLHIVASAPRLRELLGATGLDMLVPIHATLSAALGDIRGS